MCSFMGSLPSQKGSRLCYLDTDDDALRTDRFYHPYRDGDLIRALPLLD